MARKLEIFRHKSTANKERYRVWILRFGIVYIFFAEFKNNAVLLKILSLIRISKIGKSYQCGDGAAGAKLDEFPSRRGIGFRGERDRS